MSRINSNIPSMVATRVLTMQNKTLNQSLNRLSTGLRINSGKDDPAGLIASELLRAERAAIGAAITNIGRANNVVATAEGGLDEINKLLTELEDLVDRSSNEAGISQDERAANQLQIDSVLDSVNRIANSTEFQGRKLLDGTFEYTTSGIDNTDFSDVDITAARIANGAYRNVVVEVTASAQLAALTYAGGTTSAGTTTIEIQGNHGADVFSFASGTAISAVVAAINQAKDLTGVSAVAFSATGLRLNSTDYGSDQFVSVNVLAGSFNLVGGATKDFGQDAGVTVNGVSADVSGLEAHLQTSTLSLRLDLASTFATTVGNSSSFQVTGGGADFMIAPTVSLNGLASLGVRSVSTGSLGGKSGVLSSLGSGQANSLSTGNFSVAQRVIREAQSKVAQLRGRLGAFQKDSLETTANALNITLENTTAAESAIRDTDFAVETSNLSRSQILVQAATNMLRIANAQPQQALSLLG